MSSPLPSLPEGQSSDTQYSSTKTIEHFLLLVVRDLAFEKVVPRLPYTISNVFSCTYSPKGLFFNDRVDCVGVSVIYNALAVLVMCLVELG